MCNSLMELKIYISMHHEKIEVPDKQERVSNIWSLSATFPLASRWLCSEGSRFSAGADSPRCDVVGG